MGARAAPGPARPRLGRSLPAIIAAVEALAVSTCTIDGEVIACRKDGLADFEFSI
jgi:ATP-dependent DNA ligase